MSEDQQSNGRAELPENGSSVLAGLPRTRPQRATARRAAARGTGARRAGREPEKPAVEPDSDVEATEQQTASAAAVEPPAAPAKRQRRTAGAKPARTPGAKPARTPGAKPAGASAEKPAGASRAKSAVADEATSRAKAAVAGEATPGGAKKVRTGAAGRAGAAGQAAAAKPARRARSEPVPRQGYESEGERVSGAVPPPGPTELFSAATELLGELAKAGLSGGERLLKDALSLLSR